MAISFYDSTIPGFVQCLGAMELCLAKGRTFCLENGIDLDAVVETRLISDMAPFRFQVAQIAHHTSGAIAGVRKGVFSPDPVTLTADYGDLQKIIAEASAVMVALTREEVDGFEGKDVLFEHSDLRLPFTAETFLLSFSTPNLYFHATTAYDILRMKGVPLGKLDFLGHLRLKA